MHKYLKKLIDERNSLTGLMQSVSDKAAEEDRELTDAESERMRGWQERAAKLDTECSEHSEYLETQRSWARLQDRLTESVADDGSGRAPALVGATRGAAANDSWGELFTRSAAFQTYTGYGTSGRVELPGVMERAPIDTTFLDVPPSTFLPTPWKMTTPLLDAIGRERVSSGNVEWVSYPGSYPLAGVVAEGALKPEATFAPTVNNASLNTYAHHKGITRQALEDLPRIQNIVENALRSGILLKIEADTAAALLADATIPTAPAADLLTGIRVGIGEVQANGYSSPTGILLNPADYADLDMTIMGGTLGGPSVNQSFWGIRAYAVGAIPAGTAYVGDLKTGLTLFDRAQTAVYLTDSHADNFLRNILVVLAEARALPVVTGPEAMYKVTTGAAAASTASAKK
jgi:HK97 family phage major capsid protein